MTPRLTSFVALLIGMIVGHFLPPLWFMGIIVSLLVGGVLWGLVNFWRQRRLVVPSPNRIVEIVEAMPSDPSRDELLRDATLLQREADSEPVALRLARSVRDHAATKNSEELQRHASGIVAHLEREERRKNRGSAGGGLVVLLALLVVWLLLGPFPMYAVYYLTYLNPALVNDYFPVQPSTPPLVTPQAGNTPPPPFLEFLQHSGAIGDTFGGINSFLSAAALAGAIYSILLQGRELSLQRDEMAMTRRELARTADAQSRSEAALEAQAHISGLHYLAEFERQQQDQIEDSLARHRARGRQRAHLAKLETTLHTFRTPQGKSDQKFRHDQIINEFSFSLLRHEGAFDECRQGVADHQNSFGPANDALVHLAEDVAWIDTFKIPGNFASLCIQGASSLITDIVKEQEIEPALPPNEARQFQIGRCDRCFRLLDKAVKAMRHPEKFDTPDLTADYMVGEIEFLLAYQNEDVADEA